MEISGYILQVVFNYYHHRCHNWLTSKRTFVQGRMGEPSPGSKCLFWPCPAPVGAGWILSRIRMARGSGHRSISDGNRQSRGEIPNSQRWEHERFLAKPILARGALTAWRVSHAKIVFGIRIFWRILLIFSRLSSQIASYTKVTKTSLCNASVANIRVPSWISQFSSWMNSK